MKSPEALPRISCSWCKEEIVNKAVVCGSCNRTQGFVGWLQVYHVPAWLASLIPIFALYYSAEQVNLARNTKNEAEDLVIQVERAFDEIRRIEKAIRAQANELEGQKTEIGKQTDELKSEKQARLRLEFRQSSLNAINVVFAYKDCVGKATYPKLAAKYPNQTLHVPVDPNNVIEECRDHVDKVRTALQAPAMAFERVRDDMDAESYAGSLRLLCFLGTHLNTEDTYFYDEPTIIEKYDCSGDLDQANQLFSAHDGE